MKKNIILVTVLIAIFIIFVSFIPNRTYAVESTTQAEHQSKLLELKEEQAKTLEEYQKKYNSEPYGLTAYILHLVQIYSIPICFLGIVISLIYKTVIGRRNLENAERGLGMSIAFITITIICQVLPLVFALVVKLGK